MKKRIISWLLALGVLASLLTVPAGAAATVRFSDVSDSYTATAVEALRLMGVLDGYGDGTFRPTASLNRAQFCKMAVYAMDGSGELGRYSTVTIFPDVKPSHWAASYINMASKKGVIAGFADGRFQPDRTVTAGQAVTILMRGLGYQDGDMGGVWPQGYMAEAESCGLLKSTGITSAFAPLTRAQAAKLFLNLFTAKKGGGETQLFSYTLSDEVLLTAVDGGKGTLTAGGKTYDMARPTASTSLVGTRGKVVTNAQGEALTFLPVTEKGGISGAAVIIGSNGSAAGLNALAGGGSYTIYKNGAPASAADLRSYDVATFSPDTNAVLVSDTRVTVYYEDCSPSPSAPTTLTAMGREWSVLPTAAESLSKFKPGQQITLLLTADGQVAGAAAADNTVRSTAVAVVNSGGDVQLLCGGGLITVGSNAALAGRAVSVSSTKSGVSFATLSASSGDLDTSAKTLGSKRLASNVLIFDGGEQVGLSGINRHVNSARITYAHTNWAGEVDLIMMNGGTSSDVIYGRAVVSTSKDTWIWNADAGDNAPKTAQSGYMEGGKWVWNDGYGPYATRNEGVNGYYTTSKTIAIETPSKTYGPINSGNGVSNGAFVAVKINRAGTMFDEFNVMSKFTNVFASAWIGKTAVNCGGKTYDVASNVPCYNADTGKWTDLDTARDYGGTMNVYTYDGEVRAIEYQA